MVRIENEVISAALTANSALYTPDPPSLLSATGAVVLRWEIIKGGGTAELAQQPGVESRQIQASSVQLDGTQVLLRCDRVDFTPGGIGYLHTHQGPGIRCRLHGAIRVEFEGHDHQIHPLGTWFEAVPSPVLARASQSDETGSARVMLLPVTLLGRSSIQYVNAGDQAKPKPQRYQGFLDRVVSL